MSTVSVFNIQEDLGDAFATLYDLLAATNPTVGHLEAYLDDARYKNAQAATHHAIAHITSDLWITSKSLHDALADGPPAIFGALTAIDLTLSRADPSTPPSTTDVIAHRALRRLKRTGGFHLTPGAGAVLRKRVRPTRPSLAPESLREVFNLLRVSASTWSTVKHVLVRAGQDHAVTKLDALRIASLPMGAEPADLSMTSAQTNNGRRIYLAAPSSNICDRVPHAADVLVNSDADVAVLPEVTLDASALMEWRNQHRNQLPTWILIGTGPVDAPPIPGATADLGTTQTPAGPLPPNRAVLMHGPSGQVIAGQDKQFGFTIPVPLLPGYGLGAAAVETHAEGIEVASDIAIIESNAGRFAIFVCEDLSRLPQLAHKVQELGITHMLTPILATPILLHRWQQNSAQHLTTHVGTTVVVFNSLSLGRFHSSTSRGAYTMMLIKPDHVREQAVTTAIRNKDAKSMTAVADALTLRTDSVDVC